MFTSLLIYGFPIFAGIIGSLNRLATSASWSPSFNSDLTILLGQSGAVVLSLHPRQEGGLRLDGERA